MIIQFGESIKFLYDIVDLWMEFLCRSIDLHIVSLNQSNSLADQMLIEQSIFLLEVIEPIVPVFLFLLGGASQSHLRCTFSDFFEVSTDGEV